MSTRAQRNRRAKKSRYLLLAILGLMSFIAYTTHYNNSPKHLDSDRFAEAVKQKSTARKNQDLLTPFAQRWEKIYTDAENYLLDDDYKKTHYFFEGYNVASNDEFVLPTEETGAGNGTEQHIQDLSDAIVAELVPTGYTSGGPSSSGPGAGGGGAGGGRGDNNRTQYVAKEDLEQEGNDGTTGESSTNGNLSAVPVPPAIWLLGSAMIGLIGLRRK